MGAPDLRNPIPYLIAAGLACDSERYHKLHLVMVDIAEHAQTIMATNGHVLVRYHWTDARAFPFIGAPGRYLVNAREVEKHRKGARGPLVIHLAPGPVSATLTTEDGAHVARLDHVRDGRGWWDSAPQTLNRTISGDPVPREVYGLNAEYLGLLPRFISPTKRWPTATKLLPTDRGWRFAPLYWGDDRPCLVDVLIMPVRVPEGVTMEENGVYISKPTPARKAG